MDTEVSFGHWLQKRRKALDLTQEDLAQCVACSVSAIRKIEADERRPSRQIAELLADCVGISPEDRAAFVRAARGKRRLEPPAPIPSAIYRSQEHIFHRPVSNLPAPPTPLIGRQHELAAIVQLLNNPQCQLLSLVGPPGIGKTRLAIEVVSAQQGAFVDGVYFVPLAPISSVEFIVPTIADAIGFAFYGVDDPKTQLLDYLREKHMLLLLDNFEHLLVEDPGPGMGVSLLTGAIERAPGVKLLVTSQERLNLQGEWLLEIEGLPYPEDKGRTGTKADPVAIAQFPAVALFVDRAHRVDPDFALTEASQPDVTRICWLVEGMPLAIELAASWVRVLSPGEIAQEIEHNLDFLATSARDVPERHRSLRAAFDHSWNLLSAEERRAMRQLSVFRGVFRGGFRREAAQQVTGASLPLLSALIDKSLLRRDARGRYGMHELVRQYAATHLEADPEEYVAVHDQHCTYYATLLQQHEQSLRTGSDIAVLEELGLEIDNLRLAWDWALANRKTEDIGEAMGGLFWLYEARGWLQEGWSAFRQAVTAFQDTLEPGGKRRAEYAIILGRALAYQGVFCYRSSQYGRARDLLEQSLALLRPSNAPAALSESLLHLAYVLYGTGAYTEARQIIQESLAISETIEHPWMVAACLTILAGIAHALGEYQEAKDRFRESLAIWREVGAPRGTAFCLTLFSATVYALGNYGEAQNILRESLEISHALGDRWGVGTALSALGMLAQARRDYAEAQSVLRESLALFRELGDRLGIAQTLNHLGEADSASGAETEARRSFLTALKIAIEMQTVPVVLDALVGLAALLIKEESPERALELVAHVLSHPASSKEAQYRAEQLWADLQAQLTPPQIEAARVRAQGRTLDTLVEQLLDVERVQGETL